MGIFEILKGLADTADVIPGIDPIKGQQGVLSQLLGLNKQPVNPSGVPPMMPQMGMNAVQKPSAQPNMPAPGGANPFQQYEKPRGAFARMFTPNTYDRQYDAGHQNFLATQGKQYDAQQAQRLAAQERQRLTQLGQTSGLSGQDLLAFTSNPEKFGESYAENFAPQEFSAGNSYSMRGGPVQQAPQGNELTTDGLGRPQVMSLDTGQGVGDPVGAAKPVNLASGARMFDPSTGEEVAANTGMTDYERGKLHVDSLSATNDRAKDEGALRKEYLSQNKGFQEVQRAYERVNAVDTSNAAGQMGLIFQYMKMLDPGSTVREGEFATAQNTTGIPGQVLNAYNKAAQGEFLNPAQVDDFKAQADNLYQAAADGYNQSYQTYQGMSESYGYDTSRAVPDLRSASDQPIPISGDAEYDALPSGAQYVGPDGVTRVKP